MRHANVNSSNLYSLGYESGELEVRFRCQSCNGAGCSSCVESGHTGTYKYADVPPAIHARVLAGEPAEQGGKPSVGSAFNRLVRGKFAGKKE